MWKVRIFTLYPELFPGPFGVGLCKKAIEKKLWSLEVINIRDYSLDKHKTVDDPPFGGGSGMLMRADVIANSLDKNISNNNEPIIYLSPKGKKFDQSLAKKLSKLKYSVPEYINSQKDLLNKIFSIETASISDGGEGALIIKLKKL